MSRFHGDVDNAGAWQGGPGVYAKSLLLNVVMNLKLLLKTVYEKNPNIPFHFNAITDS